MTSIAHNRMRNNAFLLTLIPALTLLGCPGSASQAGSPSDSIGNTAARSKEGSISDSSRKGDTASTRGSAVGGSADGSASNAGGSGSGSASGASGAASLGSASNASGAASPGSQAVRSGTSSDSTIKTKRGVNFDVRLRAAVGQGYSWILLDSVWKNIRQRGQQSFEPLVNSKPGSDGIQVFHFTALAAGTASIRFVYAQPFVKPYPENAARKTIHVEIQ